MVLLAQKKLTRIKKSRQETKHHNFFPIRDRTKIGHGKGLSEIPTVKAYTQYFSNFNLAKKIVTFSKIYLLLFQNQQC